MRKIILLLIYLLLVYFSPVSATTYISDHFDAQDDWVGSVDPPAPWVGCGGGGCGATTTFIDNTDDAHVGGGSTGKCFRVLLNGGIGEKYINAGAEPHESPDCVNDIEGKSEYYVGCWFKHTDWCWSVGTKRYKWLKYFHGGVSGTVNLADGSSPGGANFFWNDGVSAETHLRAENVWTDSDTDWHSYIIYFKHNTISNTDGAIRLWYDGEEVSYSYPSGHFASNTAISFDSSASTFTFSDWWGPVGFGYQKYNFTCTNVSYFDDIIFASTLAEVITFLGESGPPPATDPEIAISSDLATINEPDGVATLTFTCIPNEGDCDGLGVDFTASGGEEGDYTLVPASHVTISGTTATATLTAANDADTDDEVITISVDDGVSYDLGSPYSTVVTINDDDEPPSDTGLPLSDDFEDAFDAKWDYVAGAFSIVSSGCYSGDCARATVVDDSINNDIYTDLYFGIADGKTASTEITWSGYSKINEPTAWPEYGNKIGIVNLYLEGVRTYQVILGVCGTETAYEGEYCMETTKVVSPTYYTTRPQNQGTPTECPVGEWVKWKVYCKLNTPGASEDVLKLWINNELKLNYTDIAIRQSTSASFGKLNMSSGTTTTAKGTYYAFWDEWLLQDGNVGGASISGTISDGATEAQIVAGGQTLIITLDGYTWVATVGGDNEITTALIAGIDSGGTETNGWDAVVKANMVYTDIERPSDTVVEITLGAEATYSITTPETVTVTIPATALVESEDSIVATPTFEITATSDPVAALTGTLADNATEAQIVAGGETLIITLTDDTWVAAGATFDGQRQAIINGMDSAQSEATGWDAEVKAKEVVTAVVRTNNTIVTITLTAAAAYDVSANETLTVTVPAAALVTSASPVVATPTADIIFFSTATEKITGMTLQ